MPLGKKFGGRTKGTPNKGTQKRAELTAKLADEGITPLEYLLSVMRAPVPIELQNIVNTEDASEDVLRALSSWHAQRVDAAKAAAPYVHPRLNAVHMTEGDKKSFEDWVGEMDDPE